MEKRKPYLKRGKHARKEVHLAIGAEGKTDIGVIPGWSDIRYGECNEREVLGRLGLFS
ncbi:MAG: hypothetical protein ABID54_02560 [Pseudomonadota bacterium]